MHFELFVVILSLCGSGLGLPTVACPSRDCKSGEKAEGGNVFDFFTSIFNQKNETSLSDLETKSRASGKDAITLGQNILADPSPSKFTEEGIDAINAKYNDYVKNLSPDYVPEAPTPINLLDVVGNLGHVLEGAKVASDNFGKDLRTIGQVETIQLKAINKVANIFRKHPEFLSNIANLIDTVPDSFDFSDPEVVLKTVQTVEKLNPGTSSQVYDVLKEFNINEQIIPKDLVNQITGAIASVTDQIANS